MKVAVIADTHGRFRFIGDLRKKNPDLIFHLGDYARDGADLRDELGIATEIVRGNNDFGSTEPLERILEIGNHRVLLIHGHRHRVHFGPDRLYFYAEEKGVDLVFYGHSHAYRDDEYKGIRLINPGSPSLPRGDYKASYLIWDTDRDSFKRIFV